MTFWLRGVFCVAFVVLAVHQAAGQELTEKELIERFLAHNPQLRELQAGFAALREDLRGRTFYPNPTAIYTREGAGFAEFFEFEQPIILTDRRRHLREAGTAALRASEYSMAQNMWELRSDLRLAFHHLLEAQEKQRIMRSAIGEFEKVVQILRVREAEGEGSRFDLIRADRELFESRADLSTVEAALASLQNTLTAITLVPQLSKTRAIGDMTHLPSSPSVEDLIKRALARRQDYLAAKTQIERFAKEELAARRLRIPDPILTVGFKRGEGFPTTRNGSVVAVTVPIPLFDRGQAKVAIAEAEQEKARARLDFLERQIQAQVTAAHAAYALRKTMVEQYRRETEKSGMELVAIAKTAYEEGEKTILELLDVYRVSRQAELRVLELLTATKDAQIEIDRVVGEEVFP